MSITCLGTGDPPKGGHPRVHTHSSLALKWFPSAQLSELQKVHGKIKIEK